MNCSLAVTSREEISKKTFARHFCWLRDIHELEDGRRDIGQDAGRLAPEITPVDEFSSLEFRTHKVERDGIRIMLRFRLSRLRIHHLLEVAVVGGNDDRGGS